jgi:glycosyltransferase involved in cell wall biosynthesis
MKRKGILFIIENLPIPLDRRVLLEASAVRSSGVPVYVICPRGKDKLDRRETLDNGIKVFRYSDPPETRGYLSFFIEFSYCLLRTFILSVWIFFRHGFHAIHTANPPDTFFLVALFYKVFGVRFVYDQHDICPELFVSRFDKPNPVLLKALHSLEKFSYKTADLVISPNQSYREIALDRGHVRPDRCAIVRSAPDEAMLEPRDPCPSLKHGSKWLLIYLGVMGPQDGVDILLKSYAHLLGKNRQRRADYFLALIGDGDLRKDLELLASDLQISDRLYFPGFLMGNDLMDHLATADIGLCPDPPTPFNTHSTMNKVLEYMAFGVPVVSFDLKETHFSADTASIYVSPCAPEPFADAVQDLLDQPDLRRQMGQTGRQRIHDFLGWSYSKKELINAYRNAGLIQSSG